MTAAQAPWVQLEAFGYRASSPWPYSQPAGDTTFFDVKQRPARVAWRDPHIQINPRGAIVVDLHDVDDPQRHAWGWAGPQPSWTVWHAANGHMHVGYVLADPVRLYDGASLKAQAFYADVHQGLTRHIGGDLAYRGFLTRNPIAPGDGCFTEWGRQQAYTLGELRAAVPDDLMRQATRRRLDTPIGQNVTLFAWAIKEAHRPRVARRLIADPAGHKAAWWKAEVEAYYFMVFDAPHLDAWERRAIAKSSAKYSLAQFSESTFSAIQRRRGVKSGKARVNEARDVGIVTAYRMGKPKADIAEAAGLSRRHVNRILARARSGT